MSKFKVGDRVMTAGNGLKVYGHVKNDTEYTVCRVEERGHVWIDVPCFFDTCFNEAWLVRAPQDNTIQLNEIYASKNGQDWLCISIIGDVAWLVGMYDGKPDGAAYMYKLDGSAIQLANKSEEYDIKWSPVVEWVDYLAELVPHGERVLIKFPLIDGKPDFTQATVTPISDS